MKILFIVAVANRKSLQLLSLRRKIGVGNGGNQAGIQPAREECRHGYVRDKLALNGIRHQVTDFSRRGRKIIGVVVVGQLPVGVQRQAGGVGIVSCALAREQFPHVLKNTAAGVRPGPSSSTSAKPLASMRGGTAGWASRVFSSLPKIRLSSAWV